MRFRIATLALTLVFATLGAQEQETWSPPRLEHGASPGVAVMAISGGEVFLEVTVSETGTVSHIEVLRTTPPFTDLVLNTVRDWTFVPAERMAQRPSGTSPSTGDESATEPVASKVFVAAIFRPPALYATTLGSPPTDVSEPTPEVAAPVSTITPDFPPQALLSGAVLTEVTIGVLGGVTDAEVVQPAAGFNEAAVAAARQWSFRPARVDGRLEETHGYIAFIFRLPNGTQGAPEPGCCPRDEPRPPG